LTSPKGLFAILAAPILVKRGQIKVKGAVYEMASGTVKFLD
jgi:hypothetical protein